MHNKKARQTRCRKSQRPRKRRRERCDKHLDHMTLTTLLPLHVSIDFCHADTHTCTQTHTHKHSAHTQTFSTLCKQFSSLFKTKVFLYPLNKTIETRATDYVKSCLLMQTLSSVSFVVTTSQPHLTCAFQFLWYKQAFGHPDAPSRFTSSCSYQVIPSISHAKWNPFFCQHILYLPLNLLQVRIITTKKHLNQMPNDLKWHCAQRAEFSLWALSALPRKIISTIWTRSIMIEWIICFMSKQLSFQSSFSVKMMGVFYGTSLILSLWPFAGFG